MACVDLEEKRTLILTIKQIEFQIDDIAKELLKIRNSKEELQN